MVSESTRADTKMNAAEVLLGEGLSVSSGDNIAILTDEESVSYNQLEAAASRAAHAIHSLGVGPGERVLIMADDRPEFFFAYLGAMKLGAIPVALNLRFSESNLAYIMEDSACKLFLADRQFVDLLRTAMAAMTSPPTLSVLDVDFPGLMAEQLETFESHACDPDDMGLWMYTSGTTGKPKAVVHRQGCVNTIGRYLGPVYGVGPGDKIFCSSKLFFAFSLGHCLLGALRLGATVILHAGWPSAEAVSGVVERHRPDVVLSVPTLFRALLEEGCAGSPGFDHVRYFISAGEHLPKTLSQRWYGATGHQILQGIGATEALIMFIGNRPDDYQPGATGKPLPGTDVKLVTDGGELIEEPGIPGVLWVRSDCLALQYWNQEDRTKAAFRDGWYITGDVFVIDGNGFYHYQGRDDDMLKISGQWVSPAEIEEHVLSSPKVSDAAVIGVEDVNGLIRLALCLVPAERLVDRDALREELTDHLTQNLSIYKCPRRFIFLDEMPQTATGKTQRFKLRQIAADYLDETLAEMDQLT